MKIRIATGSIRIDHSKHWITRKSDHGRRSWIAPLWSDGSLDPITRTLSPTFNAATLRTHGFLLPSTGTTKISEGNKSSASARPNAARSHFRKHVLWDSFGDSYSTKYTSCFYFGSMVPLNWDLRCTVVIINIKILPNWGSSDLIGNSAIVPRTVIA